VCMNNTVSLECLLANGLLLIFDVTFSENCACDLSPIMSSLGAHYNEEFIAHLTLAGIELTLHLGGYRCIIHALSRNI
jgi:hypothetical protein